MPGPLYIERCPCEFRAFTDDSWVAVFFMTAIAALCILITSIVLPKAETSNGQKIMAFSIWLFFVVINSFYGGALTRFFTSTVTIPLETRRDVMRAYPDWNLIFKDGAEINFVTFVLQGDQDFMEYWTRDQADPTETRVGSIKEGLDRIAQEQTVFFIDDGQLKGWLRANPFHVQRLDIFGHELPTYDSLLFSLNSPLVPMFRAATFTFRQQGTEYALIKRWFGEDINEDWPAEKTTLTPGQGFHSMEHANLFE